MSKTRTLNLGLLGALLNSLPEMQSETEVKKFQPMPADGVEALHSFLDEVKAIPPERLDSAFLTIVIQDDKVGQFCESCNTVHTEDDISQMVLALGSIEVLEAATRNALGEVTTRAIRREREDQMRNRLSELLGEPGPRH